MRQAAVANQFVPLNTNPKEVLEMRNKVGYHFNMDSVDYFNMG